MRQRHAARVQRPHGQIPKAIRPDTDGHTAESPRTRSRIHSPTLSGPSATTGPPRPGITDIHVTKSLRSMPMSMTQQDIQLSKSPGSMPTSMTRRNIHNAKSSRSTAPSVPGCWHRIRSDNDDDDDDLRLWYRYRTGSHDADLD